MACHRCPNDDSSLCSWCCPDPARKAVLVEASNKELREAHVKDQAAHGFIPTAFLCDAVRVLESHGLLDELPKHVAKVYKDHRAEEDEEAEDDDDGVDPIFNLGRG